MLNKFLFDKNIVKTVICEILLQFKTTIFYWNVIYSCDVKAELSASLLKSSEIILICWFAQETFLGFFDE